MSLQRISFQGKEMLMVSGDNKQLEIFEIVSEGEDFSYTSKLWVG
jgi:hypothetical protein